MMKLNLDKFQYKNLIQVTKQDGERYYQIDNMKLPSVTTILSKTSNKKEILDNWKKRVGEKEAHRIVKESIDIGTLVHKNLENHLLNEKRTFGNNIIHKLSYKLADVIINNAFSNLSEIWGIESQLYYPELFAGTSDLIGIYKNKECICDYKTSRKEKTIDMIEDYLCQLIAYANAHNELYGTNIKCGVIFMVMRDCSYKEFIIDENEFKKYNNIWCNKLEQFYSEN